MKIKHFLSVQRRRLDALETCYALVNNAAPYAELETCYALVNHDAPLSESVRQYVNCFDQRAALDIILTAFVANGIKLSF